MSRLSHGTTVDECSGSWSSNTDFLYGGDCFDFTDGLTHDPWGTDGALITEKCSYIRGQPQYAYKLLSSGVSRTIETLVTISGWRHACPDTTPDDYDPFLSVAFSESVPQAGTIGQITEWIELGNSNLTQLLNLQSKASSVKKGAYVVLKYECNGANGSECKKMKMHLISCYTDSLVDPANF